MQKKKNGEIVNYSVGSGTIFKFTSQISFIPENNAQNYFWCPQFDENYVKSVCLNSQKVALLIRRQKNCRLFVLFAAFSISRTFFLFFWGGGRERELTTNRILKIVIFLHLVYDLKSLTQFRHYLLHILWLRRPKLKTRKRLVKKLKTIKFGTLEIFLILTFIYLIDEGRPRSFVEWYRILLF